MSESSVPCKSHVMLSLVSGAEATAQNLNVGFGLHFKMNPIETCLGPRSVLAVHRCSDSSSATALRR